MSRKRNPGQGRHKTKIREDPGHAHHIPIEPPTDSCLMLPVEVSRNGGSPRNCHYGSILGIFNRLQ